MATVQVLDTTIGHLPFELIKEIFKNLQHKDRQKIRFVSRRWDEAITGLFMVELRYHESNWRTMLKTDGRFLSVVLPSLGEELGYRLSLRQPLRDFRSFCSRLQKLEFSGTMISDNFPLILRNCPFLKKLRLSKVLPTRRFHVQTESWDEIGRPLLQNLQSLGINFERCDTLLAEQLNLFKLVANMLVIGKLVKLKIESDDSWDFQTTPLQLLHGSPAVLPADNRGSQRVLKRLIIRNKSTIRKLVIIRTIKYLTSSIIRLQFYPLGLNNGEKLRVERYTGTQEYFHFRGFMPPQIVPGKWLQFLLCQDGLKTLDVKLYDWDFFVLEFPRQVEMLMTQIIMRNAATLTAVSLGCRFYSTKNPSLGFPGAFQHCTHLTSLTILDYSERFWLKSPTFTGIEELPSSLKYFHTNFSIGTQAAGIGGLQLSNLKNLEDFTWLANPWFVFRGIPHKKITIKDLDVLISKLPGLKTLLLRIQIKDGNAQMNTRPRTVTPGLIKMFKNNVTEETDGLYLKVGQPQRQ